MTVKFENIGFILNNMSERQIRIAMDIVAVKIQNAEIVDKFDFMNAVKIGLSMPEK